MAKAKGTTKTGGRKLGTPNKRTLELIEALEDLGVDPVQGDAEILDELKALLCDKKHSSFQKKMQVLRSMFTIYSDLMQYMYPKRKAIDHAGRPRNPLDELLRLTPEERTQRITEIEKRLKA